MTPKQVLVSVGMIGGLHVQVMRFEGMLCTWWELLVNFLSVNEDAPFNHEPSHDEVLQVLAEAQAD